MVAAVGIYQNGYVKFDKNYTSVSPVKVIVTFLEDVGVEQREEGLSLSHFSFTQS